MVVFGFENFKKALRYRIELTCNIEAMNSAPGFYKQ